MSGAFASVIAPLTEADLPEVAQLEAADPSPWTPAMWTAELQQPAGRQWAWRERPNGCLLGYLSCRAAAGEAEILKLAVATGARRRGGATRLLAHACRELRAAGSKSCFLELRASNRAARELYQKMGFRTINRRPGYYADPREDALIMMKNL